MIDMKHIITLVAGLSATLFSTAQNSYSVTPSSTPCAPFEATFTPSVGPNVGIINYDLNFGGPPQTDFTLAPVELNLR